MQFGSSPSSGRRWVARTALACLVLAAIVAVAVRGTGQHPRHAAKTPPPPPMVVMVAGHPLLGVTARWELFARGPDDLLRFELAQGRIKETYVPTLASANANVEFVIGAHEAVIRSTDLVPGYVVPDTGEARELTGPLAGGGPLIPGPAGSQAVWVTTGSSALPALSLVTLTGRRAGPTIHFQPGQLLPATATADGRGYVLTTIGLQDSVYDTGPGWERPVPGAVLAVGRASWLVLACNRRYSHCHNEVVDIADGARRVLRGTAAAYPYDLSWPPPGVIAPDDRTAAVAESGRDGRLSVHLINLRSGANRNLEIVMDTPGSSVPLGAGLNDESMAWSPDSRWLFVAAAGGKLVVVNARTGSAVDLGLTLPPVTQVAIRA